MSIFLKVATTHRDHFHAQPAQLAQIAPHGGEIELAIRGGVRKNSHQVPIAIRTVSLASAAAEQPDLLRIEHLDDALDDSWRDGRGDHGWKPSEFEWTGQGR